MLWLMKRALVVEALSVMVASRSPGGGVELQPGLGVNAGVTIGTTLQVAVAVIVAVTVRVLVGVLGTGVNVLQLLAAMARV